MTKRKVIVDYKNVPEEVLQKLAEKYPHGYNKAIIKFQNAKGETVSVVPIETDDTSYLVKVSTQLQTMVNNVDVDDFDDLVIEVDTPAKGAFGDDEFDNNDDEDDRSYRDEEEDSLDDHMEEAENIADDSDY
ncbi:MAG: hypothetical protein LC105_07865 [Chitinophagales bacterium]|nr:hypothetical protein [Chitinophagales bacterium]MCZ2393754.1 hypothetical protein [Chitinophagales bacterium]